MIPKRVLIFGGTHGNEWIGIQVVKHYAEHFIQKYPSLELEFVLANPEAHQLNRRFKDEDLNRAFQFLDEKRDSSYEHQRAEEIRDQIQRTPCLVIDLHTTTSNMGATVILPTYKKELLGLCSVVGEKNTDLRFIGAPDPKKKYLSSQSALGLIIEVGPVANSVIQAQALESTVELLEQFFQVISSGDIKTKGLLEVYEEARDVHYPLNEKIEISGYIHSAIQGQDFKPLRGKFSAFKEFSGQEIELDCTETLYPIFVNEAAYYPQQLAFTLCRKRMLEF